MLNDFLKIQQNKGSNMFSGVFKTDLLKALVEQKIYREKHEALTQTGE